MGVVCVLKLMMLCRCTVKRSYCTVSVSFMVLVTKKVRTIYFAKKGKPLSKERYYINIVSKRCQKLMLSLTVGQKLLFMQE